MIKHNQQFAGTLALPTTAEILTTTTLLTKREERREKFRLIGERISQQAWKDRLGEHSYELHGRAVQDPSVSSRIFGPRMKTLQWERSSKVVK